MSRRRDATGLRIDQYEVLRLIGEGGTGWVYLARDTQLGRKTAIKVLRPDSGISPAVLLAEAQATARLSHPNIVTIYSAGRFADTAYLALEYLEGLSLRQRLKQGRMGVAEALPIIIAVAAALAEAHAQGIIHRDVKPENVFLCRDERVRVLDFGLARCWAYPDDGETLLYAGPEATPRGVQGTVGYIAPEQWGRGAPTPAMDVWALGVTLYEVIAGERPFRSPREALQAASRELIGERFAQASAAVDQRLVALVVRCLGVEPGTRPQAAEVVGELTAALTRVRQAPPEQPPFRGLLPYQREHAEIFCGRDPPIADALRRLEALQLLAVVGAPGAGKSSFVEAGLIPAALSAGYCEGVVVRPGPQPFLALARQLMRAATVTLLSANEGDLDETQQEAALGERLAQQVGLLSVVLCEKARAHDARILLVVDPLEDLFADDCDAGARDRLFAALLAAAAERERRVRVVLVLRSETLSRVRTHPALAHAIEQGTFPLRAPARDVLAQVISQPLARCDYRFDDPALAEELAAAVAGSPSALALLGLALQRLWDLRDRDARALTRAGYEAMHGVGGALADHADEVLAALSGSEARAAHAICRRLVTRHGARATVPPAVALSGLGSEGQAVLRRLLDARLVCWAADGRDGDAGVTLVHDALIALGDQRFKGGSAGGDRLRAPRARRTIALVVGVAALVLLGLAGTLWLAGRGATTPERPAARSPREAHPGALATSAREPSRSAAVRDAQAERIPHDGTAQRDAEATRQDGAAPDAVVANGRVPTAQPPRRRKRRRNRPATAPERAPNSPKKDEPRGWIIDPVIE